MVDTVSEIFDGAHFVIVSSEQYLQENNTSHEEFCTSDLVSTEAERGIPEPRRTHLRSFAEDTSEASPKSPPKLRRSHLRSFAEVTSEASPKSTPKLRRSHLRSFGGDLDLRPSFCSVRNMMGRGSVQV